MKSLFDEFPEAGKFLLAARDYINKPFSQFDTYRRYQMVPLIEVAHIKPKMLKQIRVLSAYGTPEQLELLTQIRDEMKSNKLRPIGWIMGDYLDGAPMSQEMWLVKFEEQLYFIFAPDKGSQLWRQHQPLTQLFA